MSPPRPPHQQSYMELCPIPPASRDLPGGAAATVEPFGSSRAPSGARLRSFERRGGGPRRLWQSSESVVGEGEEGTVRSKASPRGPPLAVAIRHVPLQTEGNGACGVLDARWPFVSVETNHTAPSPYSTSHNLSLLAKLYIALRLAPPFHWWSYGEGWWEPVP